MWNVISVAHNGEFERFYGFCADCYYNAKSKKSFKFAIVSCRNDKAEQAWERDCDRDGEVTSR